MTMMIIWEEEVLTIVSAREDSIMLTMLPSGYNINTAGLSQHHRVRGRVGGDALAGVGFPPQLTTEPMTGPTVPAAGGGATRVRTLMARPAGPRPHTPHYNVISNRSGRRPATRPYWPATLIEW